MTFQKKPINMAPEYYGHYDKTYKNKNKKQNHVYKIVEKNQFLHNGRISIL